MTAACAEGAEALCCSAQVPELKKHLQETLRTPENFLEDESEGQGISGPGSTQNDGQSLREVEMEKPAVEEEDD